MILIYLKETKQPVGIAARVFDNGQWREATVHELYPSADHAKMGYFIVDDASVVLSAEKGWQFKLDSKGDPVGIEPAPDLPRISLTTDAIDSDGDGLPELAADGNSQAKITLEVKDSAGKLVKKDFQIEIRTTGGALSVRRTTAKAGRATVDLTSSTQTITVTVTASAEGLETGSITFEFMPPDK